MSLALRSTVDVVEAALTAAGLSTHRGRGPDDPMAAAPYVVVYAGAVEVDGPSSARHVDTHPEVQLTCVGKSSEQAEWLADKAFDVLFGSPLSLTAPAGRAWLSPGAPVHHVLTRPVVRDDDFGAGAPVFYAIHIIALPSTPA